MYNERILSGMIIVLGLCLLSGTVSLAAEPVQMTFYGQVLDQASQPVGGVTVHALAFDSVKTDVKASNKLAAVTDSTGRFVINADGTALRINSIKKKGYRAGKIKKKELTFTYASDNPYTFTGRRVGYPLKDALHPKDQRFNAIYPPKVQ